MTQIPEEERWDNARGRLTKLGSVPGSFSSLIRKLRSDMQASPPALSPAALFELNRLLRGPALLSPLAHAALEFHPEKMSGVKNLSKSVIAALSIEELSALISALYLTRQVKKRVAPEEWKFIAEVLAPFSSLAGHLGGVITPIGFERSLLAVVFSVLGMALFQPDAVKEYSVYRRNLKKSGRYYNTADELKLMGCTSREIGSLLAQSVAISNSLATDFLAGVDCEPSKRPTTGLQALNIWIESLMKNGTAPQVAMDAKWYPTKEKVAEIEAFTARVKAGRSPTALWILKEGSDLDAITKMVMPSSGAAEVKVETEVDENVEPFEDA